MSLVTIASFTDHLDAHMLVARLQDEGIPAWARDAETARMNWLLSNAIGGVRVQVSEIDVVDAKAVIAAIENNEYALDDDQAEEARCQFCGGCRFEYTNPSRRFAFLSWAILGVPTPINKERKRCLDCRAYVED